MAANRRRRQQKSQNSGLLVDVQAVLRALMQNFRQEALGLAIFLVGGGLGFTLFTSGQESWVAELAGWLAWPLVVSLLVMGVVLMLGQLAGYWNPEAIVAMELLLLSLAILTYYCAVPVSAMWCGAQSLIGNSQSVVDWTMPPAAVGSGLMGWGPGNVLLSLFGRLPAALVAILCGLTGLYLLFRHTPLIYMTPYLRLIRWPGLPLRPESPPQTSSIETDIPSPLQQYPLPLDPATLSAHSTERTPPLLRSAESSARSNEKSAERKPKTDSQNNKPVKQVRSAPDLPPLTLLEEDAGQFGNWDIEAMGQIIHQTLWDFNIPVEIVNIESGPTVTQFGVQPQYIERAGQRRKVRVSRIASVADDLALALAAPAIRIEAPVPGQPYVGIEVPNPQKTIVGIKGILQSKQWAQQSAALPLALGRDTSGLPIISDLARAPHMLIAGATGAGKSACINGLIISLQMHHGPETLRFIMVDPKMVELPGYNKIPHMIGKVITDVDQVHGALTWLLLQMDDRYQLFREHKVRNLTTYNALARRHKNIEPLPYLVLIIDELADLMMTAPEEIERQLVRLAQMARATGIHLVIATQRPSTDVVTGLIKANFPTRLAFAVTSQVDSRVILDAPGAEKLLGQGDMLFMRPDSAKIQRIQGSYVTDAEIRQVVDWWQERNRQENPDGPLAKVAPWIGLLDRMDDEDDLLADAIDAIRDQETASTSFIQRQLRIGYPRAARLISLLEDQGVIGADQGGGRGRPVLLKDRQEMTPENAIK